MKGKYNRRLKGTTMVQRRNGQTAPNMAVIGSITDSVLGDAVKTGAITKKEATLIEERLMDYLDYQRGKKMVTDRMVTAWLMRSVTEVASVVDQDPSLVQFLYNAGITEDELVLGAKRFLAKHGYTGDIDYNTLLSSANGHGRFEIGGITFKLKFRYLTSNRMVSRLFELA